MVVIFKYRMVRFLFFVSALFVLIAVLAALQYHWLGQVSNGERERMGAALHAGAVRLSEDLDRELARAYVSFQMDAELLHNEKRDGFAERYARWDSSAPFPQLISGLFLISTDQRNRLQLQEFNKASKRFDDVVWPVQFEDLHRRFERLSRNSSVELPGPTAVRPLLDDDPPMLIIPVLETLRLEEKSTGSKPGVMFERMIKPPIEHIVVVLNSDYMRVLLPTLGKRYFSAVNNSSALEYTMRVVSRAHPERIIYTSESFPRDAANSTSDETINLFSLRSDLMEDFTLDGLLPARMPSSVAANSAPHADLHNTADTLMYGNGDALWQLTLRHRNGSLIAVVNNTRQRNMLVSAAILLVLTASIVLILVSAQRAQKLARQQIEFVAGVSHELRTPIAVITSAAANLSDGIVGDWGQVRRYGALISNHSHRLGEIVEQVLEFGETRSLKKAYQLQMAEVSNLIEHAIATCQAQISEHGFVIEKEIALNLPMLLIDSAAMSRAIQNLLSNAMKYSGENRSIKLRACLNTTKRGAEVVITIEDQGLGISLAELSHIFDAFHRGPEVVAAQIHGNGLGLTLVKRIVEGQGGRVTVNSRQGVGSAFSLHLPVARELPNGFGAVKMKGRYEKEYPPCRG